MSRGQKKVRKRLSLSFTSPSVIYKGLLIGNVKTGVKTHAFCFLNEEECWLT